MKKLPCAALLAVTVLAGCVTTSEPKSAKDGGESAPREAERRPAGSGSGAIAIPANVPYLPWKMIGGGLKGAGDGIAAGFGSDRMPLLGLAFSPVNAVAGFLTGFAYGVGSSPAVLGPSDDVGRAFAAPMNRKTYIWWYR